VFVNVSRAFRDRKEEEEKGEEASISAHHGRRLLYTSEFGFENLDEQTRRLQPLGRVPGLDCVSGR
jgi:hypothetical protein